MWCEKTGYGSKCRGAQKKWKVSECGIEDGSKSVDVVWTCGKNG